MSTPNEAVIPTSVKQAILDAFTKQIGIATEILTIATETPAEQAKEDSIDCMSVLTFKGTGYQGAIALGFPKSSFLPLVEKMTGEVFTDIGPQNVDACCELLNIIYASARVNINKDGFDFQPSIPTTVSGKELVLAMGISNKVLKFRCKCETGPFIVALGLKKL